MRLLTEMTGTVRDRFRGWEGACAKAKMKRSVTDFHRFLEAEAGRH